MRRRWGLAGLGVSLSLWARRQHASMLHPDPTLWLDKLLQKSAMLWYVESE